MSERANVEGARVLTTIDVPRAVSGQVGSGIRGCAAFQIIHMHICYARIRVNLDTNPFHGCAHYLIWPYPR